MPKYNAGAYVIGRTALIATYVPAETVKARLPVKAIHHPPWMALDRILALQGLSERIEF